MTSGDGGKAGFRGGLGVFEVSWGCFVVREGGMGFAASVLWVDAVVLLPDAVVLWVGEGFLELAGEVLQAAGFAF